MSIWALVFYYCISNSLPREKNYNTNVKIQTKFFQICLRLDVSSLTEIQYLQIDPSEKGTHTNKIMMLEMFYLYGFVRWTKCIWWAIENNYLLVYKFFVFAVEWIPVIRNKADIIFSLKNHLHYLNNKYTLCICNIVLPTSVYWSD